MTAASEAEPSTAHATKPEHTRFAIFPAVPVGNDPARRARVTLRLCEALKSDQRGGAIAAAKSAGRMTAASEAKPPTAHAAKPEHTRLEILPRRPQSGTAQRAARASQARS